MRKIKYAFELLSLYNNQNKEINKYIKKEKGKGKK